MSASSLLKNDHKVFAISRNVDPLLSLKSNPNNLYSLSFDINTGNYLELEDHISSFFDHIDIVINNAGLIINKPFMEINESDLQKSYGTNVFAPIYIVQCLNKMLRKI